MTNFEKITSSTLEELAIFLCDTCAFCAGCIAAEFCTVGKIGFKEWLNHNVDETK